MSMIKLFQHGEYVYPGYGSTLGTSNGRASKSTDKTRRTRKIAGTLRRFSKHESASTVALAFGLIKHCYAQAAEFTARQKLFRGLALFFGLLSAGACAYGVWDCVRTLRWEIQDSYFNPIFPALNVLILIAFFLAGVAVFMFSVRLEFFAPEDLPIIFDRANRKVYRMLRAAKPGFKGLFKPWPLIACEYEWDLVDAEHVAQLAVSSATVSRNHSLLFLVRRSADDPTIIDSFTVGDSLTMAEPFIPMLWEHIRRFMEEGGPGVPLGEGTIASRPSMTWFGTYKQFWQTATFPMVLVHLILPISVPIVAVIALLNWLSRITATPVQWPEAVARAVGPETAL